MLSPLEILYTKEEYLSYNGLALEVLLTDTSILKKELSRQLSGYQANTAKAVMIDDYVYSIMFQHVFMVD